MKARVITTGDIVDVHRLCMSSQGDIWQDKSGKEYFAYELDFDVKEPPKPRYNPDYWARLEHQAAIAAMQAQMAPDCLDSPEGVACTAYAYAHALVEKMKEERK
jgi:hypothetical protein